MKTQTLTVDGAMYTRVAAAFISGEDQLRAFKKKSVCQIGNLEDAQEFASLIEDREVRLVLLTWYWHPSLRDPILSEAIFPSSAHIILVRLF